MTSRSNRMSCAGGEFLYMSHSCVTWPVPSFASGSVTHREVTTFQFKLHNTNDVPGSLSWSNTVDTSIGFLFYISHSMSIPGMQPITNIARNFNEITRVPSMQAYGIQV